MATIIYTLYLYSNLYSLFGHIKIQVLPTDGFFSLSLQREERKLQIKIAFELRHEKTCLRDFRQGPTQTKLNKHRR